MEKIHLFNIEPVTSLYGCENGKSISFTTVITLHTTRVSWITLHFAYITPMLTCCVRFRDCLRIMKWKFFSIYS